MSILVRNIPVNIEKSTSDVKSSFYFLFSATFKSFLVQALKIFIISIIVIVITIIIIIIIIITIAPIHSTSLGQLSSLATKRRLKISANDTHIYSRAHSPSFVSHLD